MACARFGKPMHPRMNKIKAISTLVVLLASMVVVGWAEPPPSGDYNSIELVHVDAHRGFSSDELMRRAANRSRLRAATMYPEASAASGPLPPSIRSPAGLCIDLAEYFMKFYFAGTNDATSAMMDTGSDIIWTTKEECGKFNEKELLRCDDHMCKPHADCGCDSEGACQYDIKYGDSKAGKTVKGHMYKGKLSFLLPTEPGSDSSEETSYSAPMDVALGCSTVEHFQSCSSPPMTGLVGLGRGDQSLPKQLKVKNFAYCLNKYTNPDLKSILLFNNPAPDLAKGKRKKGAAKVVTTPLFRHPDEAWYFVDLKDISIGQTSLIIPAVHPQKEAGGNMFIDSGASYTHLQEDAFEKVVKELDKQLGKRVDMNCYSSKPDDASMPKMKLHFANSAVMELPWESYLWYQGEKSCLAIKQMPKGNNYHVLGNFQQQSMHMHFDIENEELKFVQADCSKVH